MEEYGKKMEEKGDRDRGRTMGKFSEVYMRDRKGIKKDILVGGEERVWEVERVREVKD